MLNFKNSIFFNWYLLVHCGWENMSEKPGKILLSCLFLKELIFLSNFSLHLHQMRYVEEALLLKTSDWRPGQQPAVSCLPRCTSHPKPTQLTRWALSNWDTTKRLFHIRTRTGNRHHWWKSKIYPFLRLTFFKWDLIFPGQSSDSSNFLLRNCAVLR